MKLNFGMEKRKDNNPDGTRYAVYVDRGENRHYVCDMVNAGTEEAVAVNELGLNLRTRLTRSEGRYAMLEGMIFDPFRLLKAACEIQDYETEEVKDDAFSKGHTLLTITADFCVNKYLIFSKIALDDLLSDLKDRKIADVG